VEELYYTKPLGTAITFMIHTNHSMVLVQLERNSNSNVYLVLDLFAHIS